MSRFNGWTNWDTWNKGLHLLNDETAYSMGRACKHQHELRFLAECLGIDDDIDYSQVNWREVHDSLQD